MKKRGVKALLLICGILAITGGYEESSGWRDLGNGWSMWEGSLRWRATWTTVYVVSKDNVWIAGYEEEIYGGGCNCASADRWIVYPCVAHWDGQDWIIETLTDFENYSPQKIYFVDENNGWLLLDSHILLRFKEGSWVLATEFPYDIQDIGFLSNTDGYAVGDRIYHYDGSSWNEVEINTLRDFTAVDFSSPENIWIVGWEGVVMWNGSGWTVMDSTHNCFSVAVVDTDDVWIGLCPYDSATVHWDGLSWETYKVPVYSVVDIEDQSRFSIWCTSGGTNEIYHFNSADSAWQQWNFPEPVAVCEIHFLDSTYGWGVGDRDILKYEKE